MKVVVVCPFWGQRHHVGLFRVDRMVRWLVQLGHPVTVISAGTADGNRDENGVKVVSVRDPLLRHRAAGIRGRHDGAILRHSKVRLILARLASGTLVPDLSALWKMRVVRDPEVIRQIEGARLVIASSPPESALLAAQSIAERCRCLLISDLRDGWLDEPLKPQLDNIRSLRYRIERRMEDRVLGRSDAILVTSDKWRQMLASRVPSASPRIYVLTNGAPPDSLMAHGDGAPLDKQIPLRLLYAGRLAGSRRERSAASLLHPLASIISEVTQRGTIVFLGARDENEHRNIKRFAAEFQAAGWELEFKPPVDRTAALEVMRSCQGLLLTSESMGCIPAKMFDYLAAMRPIFAVCPPDSAVADLARCYPQVFQVSTRSPNLEIVRSFLTACATGLFDARLPDEFSEETLRAQFEQLIQRLDGRESPNGPLPPQNTPHPRRP